MPDVEINGEKKKVACGPCIRGHRSSKCTHKDRVLIEVRKPGRPLSACPHPAGSCSCERVVINYTIPKPNTTATSHSEDQNGASANRVQKSRARKQSSSVTPSTVEKALDGDAGSLALSVNSVPEGSPKASSNGASAQSTAPAPTAAGTNGSQLNGDAPASTPQAPEPSQPPARSDIAGADGFGATPDETGWSEQYSKLNSVPFEENGVAKPPAPSALVPAAKKEQQPSASNRQCCRSKADNSTRHPASLVPSLEQSVQSGAQGQQTPFGPPVPSFPSTQQLAAIARIDSGREPAAFRSGVAWFGPAQAHQAPFFHSRDSAMAQLERLPDASHFTHGCLCGDDCSCFACPVHPQNRTTSDYVRYHAMELAGDGPFGGISAPQMPRQQPNGFQYQPLAPNGVNGNVAPFSQSASDSLWSFDGMANSHTANLEAQWPLPISANATPVSELEQFQLGAVSSQNGTPGGASSLAPSRRNSVANGHHNNHPHAGHMSVVTGYDQQGSVLGAAPQLEHDSPPQSADDTPALSPSSFLLQQFIVGGCSDATGTCLCGDGCACLGCLTHSGHEGLHPASELALSSFPAAGAAPTPTHGPSCACPRPCHSAQPITTTTTTTSYVPAQAQAPFQPPAPLPSPPTAPLPSHHPAAFSRLHGPACSCPAPPSIVQTQAQVQAHAQLHGEHCRCPVGSQFLQAHAEAEARELGQNNSSSSNHHGPHCACPGVHHHHHHHHQQLGAGRPCWGGRASSSNCNGALLGRG